MRRRRVRDRAARESWRLARQAEVREDLAHDRALGDECDQLALAAAVRAGERVEGEDALKEFGPRRAARGVDRRARAVGVVATGGHDVGTPCGRGREDAVVGQQVAARSGNERREPFDERERVERDGRRSVAPVPGVTEWLASRLLRGRGVGPRLTAAGGLLTCDS